MSKKPKIGCVAVIPLANGKYLGLNSDTRGFILPGGKYDPEDDNSFQDCAARECREETGVKVNADDVSYVWHGPDGYGYDVFAFLFTDADFKYLHDEEYLFCEGEPCEVTREQLFESKYGAYYRVMFEVLDSKFSVEE